MKQHKTKQIKIDDIQELSAKYGTVNRNSPDVLYIRAKGRIMPTVKKSDYSKEIIELKKYFGDIIKHNILSHKKNINSERYIYNIDISEKGINYKKGSYIKYDIFVKPNSKKEMGDYKNEITSFLTDVNDSIKNKLELLNIKYINKTRKR